MIISGERSVGKFAIIGFETMTRTAQQIDAAVANRGHEPAPNRTARRLKTVGVAPYREEHFLDHVLASAGIAEHSPGKAKCQTAIAIIQEAERGLVPRSDPFQHQRVGHLARHYFRIVCRSRLLTTPAHEFKMWLPKVIIS